MEEGGGRMNKGKDRKNQGFSIVEMVVVVGILTILLGVLIPSLNSILGFRVQKTSESIGGALSKLHTESMSRLAAEMKLERRDDGYYISYYLYKGKAKGLEWSDAEQIASSRMTITYILNNSGTEQEFREGDSLIFTVDRSTGGFRPLQTAALTTSDINYLLNSENASATSPKDITFRDSSNDCTSIKVKSRIKTKVISINNQAGTYTITAGKYEDE